MTTEIDSKQDSNSNIKGRTNNIQNDLQEDDHSSPESEGENIVDAEKESENEVDSLTCFPPFEFDISIIVANILEAVNVTRKVNCLFLISIFLINFYLVILDEKMESETADNVNQINQFRKHVKLSATVFLSGYEDENDNEEDFDNSEERDTNYPDEVDENTFIHKNIPTVSGNKNLLNSKPKSSSRYHYNSGENNITSLTTSFSGFEKSLKNTPFATKFVDSLLSSSLNQIFVSNRNSSSLFSSSSPLKSVSINSLNSSGSFSEDGSLSRTTDSIVDTFPSLLISRKSKIMENGLRSFLSHSPGSPYNIHSPTISSIPSNIFSSAFQNHIRFLKTYYFFFF
jgi:hypothetical protein